MVGGWYIGNGPDMDTTAVKWDPNLPPAAVGQRHAGTPLLFLHNVSVTNFECNSKKNNAGGVIFTFYESCRS